VDAWNTFLDLYRDYVDKYPEEKISSSFIGPASMNISRILNAGKIAARKEIKEMAARDLEKAQQDSYEGKWNDE
jgi:hypothetical protein